MDEPKVKIRRRMGVKTACCRPTLPGPETGPSLFYRKDQAASESSVASPIRYTSTEWSLDDYIGQIKCRVSSYRSSYTVHPGLYALGMPDNSSDVLVSANYKLSFDILRRSLKGMNAWLLVLDTKGINVWCAAGKRTFGTEELIRRISDVHLNELVTHRRIIVPQLGAPGVAAHLVAKKTGFRVYYGPVRSDDIPAYIAAGYKATKEMRTVKFTLLDRMILTPMEIIPAMKKFPVFAAVVLLFFGIQPYGIIFRDALLGGWPFLFLGLLSVFAGAFLTPLLLPIVPFRAFAVKGWIVGFISVLSADHFLRITDKLLLAFTYLFFPLLSSYIALQFTGSTTFTGMSGVNKELRYSLPVYKTAAAVSLVILAIYKLGQWGIL